MDTPRSRSRNKPGRTETATRDRFPTGAGCPGGSARDCGVEHGAISRMSTFSPQVGHVRTREGGRGNGVTQDSCLWRDVARPNGASGRRRECRVAPKGQREAERWRSPCEADSISWTDEGQGREKATKL